MQVQDYDRGVEHTFITISTMMILLQRRRNNHLSFFPLLLLVAVVATTTTTTTQGFVVPSSSSIHVVTRWQHKKVDDVIDKFPGRCQTAATTSPTTTEKTKTKTTELYMTTGMSPQQHRITNTNPNTLIHPQYEDKSKKQLHHHNHGSNLIVAVVGVFIWALMLSLLFQPLPINMEEEGGYLMYYNHNNRLPEVPNTEYVIASSSSDKLISKLQITPTPGIGFGGIGFGGGPHGFLPMPFGGFGMGFTVRNLPPPPAAPTQETTTLTTTEGNIPFRDNNNLDVQKQRLQQIQEYEKSLENQIKTMEQQQQQQQQQ